MAITPVTIANRGLQKLGASRINALTDNSTSARAMNNAYEIVKKSELQTNLWTFAIVRAQLAAETAAPAFGRDKQYQLPSNFLRLAPTTPQMSDVREDYLFEGSKLLSDDTGPLNIRYVRSDVPEGQFDPLFAEALAMRLAAETAEELTQSNSKRDAAEQAYTFFINKARATNSIETGPIEPAIDEWETVRHGRIHPRGIRSVF